MGIIKTTKERAKKKADKEMLEAIKLNNEAKEKAMSAKVKEVEFLRPIIKEKFWPLMKELSSIEEVSILCQVLSGRITESFNALSKTMTVEALKLELTDPNESRALAIIKELTMDQALQIVDGLNQAITACIRREQKKRKITELEDLTKEFDV